MKASWPFGTSSCYGVPPQWTKVQEPSDSGRVFCAVVHSLSSYLPASNCDAEPQLKREE